MKTLARALLGWYARNARDLPWRKTTDPYAVWISEIMLQQTQVKTVIPYWNRWMRRFPTIDALARSKPDQVLKCWEGLGYYTRARNLLEAARIVIAKYNGVFPKDPRQIVALPGIGRYTSGAISSIAFNLPEPILDGNVVRVLTRVFGIASDPRGSATKKRLWKLAEKLVQLAGSCAPKSERACASLNQALMELGATTCTPRQPRCPLCPIQKQCVARQRNLVAMIPKTPVRHTSVSIRAVAFVVSHAGRLLVRRRPPGKINAHLWEFPTLETDDEATKISQLAFRCLGFIVNAIQPLCSIAHTITRHRIRLEVFTATANGITGSAAANHRWCTPAQLDKLAFPSAHRKISRTIQALLKA